FDLIADSAGRHPVVVVPMHYQIASACDHALIAFLAQRPTPRRALVTDLGVIGYEIIDALVAIVQYDEFLVLIVLPLKASDRERHAGPAIRGRHYTRHKRL